MGVIAESIATYAQPLLDDTDGSIEQMNRALQVGTLCWNLALLPEEDLAGALVEMGRSLEMNEDEFEAFRRTVVVPMIRRKKEIFRGMRGVGAGGPKKDFPAPPPPAPPPVSREKYPGTGRNAPCPCNSGHKYKKCCGR